MFHPMCSKKKKQTKQNKTKQNKNKQTNKQTNKKTDPKIYSAHTNFLYATENVTTSIRLWYKGGAKMVQLSN